MPSDGLIIQLHDEVYGDLPVYPVVLTSCLKSPDSSGSSGGGGQPALTESLLNAEDRTKLDGIEVGANNYILPVATETVLGGVMEETGGVIQISDQGVITAREASETQSGIINTTTQTFTGTKTFNGEVYATKLYGAVWNDFAEYRTYKYGKPIPGQVVVECGDDTVKLCDRRLSKGAMITSDTAGIVIGQKTKGIPVAVAGRVLAYTDKPRDTFKVGDAVCSGKDGKVSKMHWWEKLLFPDRILGVVSCVPTYGVWGTGDIEVNNRIWIKI